MRSDSIHALEGVTSTSTCAERLRLLRTRATRLQAARDQTALKKTTTEAEVVALINRFDVLVKVNELFRVLLDQLILDQINKLAAIVSEGVQLIFHGTGLKFEADVTYKYNKVAVEFFFVRGEVRAPPKDAFGGGPASVAGLILRILTILRLGLRPVLFLDESLAAVSAEYVDATSQFLKRFAEKSGVDLLLVTHNPGFMDQASIAYLGTEETSGGETKFALRKVRG